MTTAVEANSLSTLTALAAHPPQYPRNPTHQQQEPLVLYIARVPGSRDVFLTPMKPKEKVVSAEDITSSLYYLHVDLPEDAELLKAQAEDSLNLQSGTPIEPVAAVPRKPLAPPRPSIDDRQPSFDVSRVPVPKSLSPGLARRPVGGQPLSPRTNVESAYNTAASNYPPKPPPHSPGIQRTRFSEDFSSTQRENFSYQQDPRRYSAQPSSQPHYAEQPPRNDARHLAPLPSYQPDRPPLSRPNSQEPQSPFNAPDSGVSLTLIRRDPSSGSQWNVAQIRDPIISDMLLGNKRNRLSGTPIDIQVLTPGYSKFLYDDERPPLATRDTGLSTASASSTGTNAPRSGQRHFQRRVCMEGIGIGPAPPGHRRYQSKDLSPLADTFRDSSDYSRGSSFDWSRSSQGARTPGVENAFQNSAYMGSQTSFAEAEPNRSRRSLRHYTFESPWNGRCDFSTGSSGRSLRCHHSIPTGVGTNAPMVPAMVSELRFNLPGTPLVSKSQSPTKDESKRSSRFLRPRFRRHKSTSPPETAHGIDRGLEKLDLSLGQEQAGGGFGGKQAKLGKLIIEDEGLKMMDLVVAANLGLWWRAYEKTDGRNG